MVVTDWAVLDTADGPMRMFMARPEGGVAGPGLLVIQEIFGVTDHIQDICRRFADEGFVALAPDLYHRFAQKTVDYDQVGAALSLYQQLTETQKLDDLNIAFRFLGARGEVRSGLVGAVGFCAGGREAFNLATTNADVLAVVSYYGPLAPDAAGSPLNRAVDLQAPALLFYGETDHLISPAERDAVEATLTRLGKDHEIVVYPGVGHGFSCDARPASYNAEAAADAWEKTVDFLYARLEG